MNEQNFTSKKQDYQFHNEIFDIVVVSSLDEKELILHMEIPTWNELINVESLIEKLKSMNYVEERSTIAYYIPSKNYYIHIGKEGSLEDKFIPMTEIENKRIIIRVRKSNFPITITKTEKEKEKNNDIPLLKKNFHRTKERTISDIIERVKEWKRLSVGVKNKFGKIEKYSLEEAASLVNISKKSLDDYLLQLRFGYKYKFNFNENKNKKVGVLRKFVKDKKKEEKEKLEIN